MAERQLVTFYLDENVPLSLAAALRSRDLDALAAQEVGLKGASDDEQTAFSIQSGRALASSNVRHFLHIYCDLYAAGRDHPGLILVTRPMTISELLRACVTLAARVTAEELRNQVVFLSDYAGRPT